MVSTLDFESSNPSSNLGGTLHAFRFHFYFHYPKAYSISQKVRWGILYLVVSSVKKYVSSLLEMGFWYFMKIGNALVIPQDNIQQAFQTNRSYL